MKRRWPEKVRAGKETGNKARAMEWRVYVIMLASFGGGTGAPEGVTLEEIRAWSKREKHL